VYVCLCKGVTTREVERCLLAGHTTAEALAAALGFHDADACGRCAREVGSLLPVTPPCSVDGRPAAVAVRGARSGRSRGW
jgi:bacterioferritin-associated ferredoxin